MQLINDLRYNMIDVNYEFQRMTDARRERTTRNHTINERLKNHENVLENFYESSMQHFIKRRQT